MSLQRILEELYPGREKLDCSIYHFRWLVIGSLSGPKVGGAAVHRLSDGALEAIFPTKRAAVEWIHAGGVDSKGQGSLV